MAIVSYKIFVEVLVSKAQSRASKEEARRKFLTTRRQVKSSSSSIVMVIFTQNQNNQSSASFTVRQLRISSHGMSISSSAFSE